AAASCEMIPRIFGAAAQHLRLVAAPSGSCPKMIPLPIFETLIKITKHFAKISNKYYFASVSHHL
ncbi:MAG: hypothetical protein IJG61_08975, partial [Lachnospiraceae bacterium]|nr:hypothetical protein [Lachnospiraceae bacterium]